MVDYRYSLVRYIPDIRRMEPTNVGLVLQGKGQVAVKISPHAAKRKEIDTQVFQRWKAFLNQEVDGTAVPLFQPDKTSPQFFDYLSQLCDGPIFMSEALHHSALENVTFKDVLSELYQRLVAPKESIAAMAASHPTGRFRQISEDRRFIRRGMKQYAHVSIPQGKLWMAYRQIDNGELIAIDKVEVNNRIGDTAIEIERIPRILEDLPKFLKSGHGTKPTRFILLADELDHPFSNQSFDEFAAMRSDLDGAIEKVRNSGGHVLRTPEEAETLATEIDERLPTASIMDDEGE